MRLEWHAEHDVLARAEFLVQRRLAIARCTDAILYKCIMQMAGSQPEACSTTRMD